MAKRLQSGVSTDTVQPKVTLQCFTDSTKVIFTIRDIPSEAFINALVESARTSEEIAMITYNRPDKFKDHYEVIMEPVLLPSFASPSLSSPESTSKPSTISFSPKVVSHIMMRVIEKYVAQIRTCQHQLRELKDIPPRPPPSESRPVRVRDPTSIPLPSPLPFIIDRITAISPSTNDEKETKMDTSGR